MQLWWNKLTQTAWLETCPFVISLVQAGLAGLGSPGRPVLLLPGTWSPPPRPRGCWQKSVPYDWDPQFLGTPRGPAMWPSPQTVHMRAACFSEASRTVFLSSLLGQPQITKRHHISNDPSPLPFSVCQKQITGSSHTRPGRRLCRSVLNWQSP